MCGLTPPFRHADIQSRDPAWYQALTQALNEEQRKHLQDIGTLADQRQAAHGRYQLSAHSRLNILRHPNASYATTCVLLTESKMIEKHGGYKFTAPVVPSSFNFGGSAPGMN